MEKLRTRLFAGGLAAFMAMSALPLQTAYTAFAAEIEAASRGDFNGDGKRNSDDLDALNKLLSEHPETILAEEQFEQYDVTEDGIIDSRDRYALSQYLSGAANELPVTTGSEAEEDVTLSLTGASCFPGDDVQVRLSFVDWTKDIAAYDLTVGFDTGLKFKDIEFISDDCVYATSSRALKISGLYQNDALHRGDIAILTFTAPTEFKDTDEFHITVEGSNVFNSEYEIFHSVKPSSTVSVQPLYEPVSLQATGIGSQSVSLKWDMPFADQPISSYRIYRDGKKIVETADTTYIDSKLKADTDYEYTVSAVTKSGAETEHSQPLSVRTTGFEIVSAEFAADKVSDANSDLTVLLSQTTPVSEMKLDITGPDGKTVTDTVDLSGEDLSSIVYHWDVSKFEDGDYKIQVTVKDVDGLSNSAETEVSVVNKPLNAPKLEGEAGGRIASLSWSLATEASVVGYCVYRKTADGKKWEKIADIKTRDTLPYKDTSLKEGTKYTYAVTSLDEYGQESAKSNSVTVTPTADKTAPEITRFTPASGKRVSGDLKISVTARDDNLVTGVRCEISSDSGKTWEPLCEAEGDTLDWMFDTTKFEDGVYQIRAMATDESKNESSGINIISLAIDNTAPEQVKNIHTVSLTATAASLAWDDVADEDFDHFIAIVTDPKNTQEYTIKKELGVQLYLVPDTSYVVTVYAVDTAGNAGPASEPFRFVAESDVTPPLITRMTAKPSIASANASLQVSVAASDISTITAKYLQYSQDQKTWKTLTLTDPYKDFVIYDKDLKEGELYLRAYARDQYGNIGDPEKAQIQTIEVDNTAPKAPAEITAAASLRSNDIVWTASESEDTVSYRIERSEGDNKSFTLLAGGITSLKYSDTSVKADGIYYYRVSAVDRAGNIGTAVTSKELHRTPDKEDPVIVECGLTSGDRIVCSVHRALQILATDNTQIASINAAYRCKETDKWTALKTTETNHNSAYTEMIVSTELPESILKETSVTIQVTATDLAGNAAVKEYTFTVDDRKAEIKDAAAKSEGKHVTVSWTCPDADGVSAFYLWRKIGTTGQESCVAMTYPKKDVTEYSCEDSDLQIGGKMIYRIMAVMQNGNSVSVTLDPIEIQAVPQAVLEYTPSQVLGASYNYDARGSRIAEDITSVEISFGDETLNVTKTSVKNAVFSHTYAEPGTYTVSLTVTNASGLSDTFTGNVTVAEPDIMSKVTATVTKMDGTPAVGAAVYVDVGTDHQSKFMTNASGKVEITCTAGDHEFGVFGNGYLPATQSVTLAPGGSTELNFSIVEDQLVKADFSVHRMTLSEIKAEGIDVKDPENCQLVKIDVELSYTITSTVTEHIKIYYDRSSGIVVGSGRGGSGGSGGSGSGGSSDYDYYIKTISHDVNTVVLMRVPVKAQFIKEFFKVDMIVMNNADAGFSLTDCTASLNLPSGLTLIENTPSSSPRVVNMGTIGGGSQETVSWIVRGDKNGNYNFDADFSGVLQPFNEPVSLNFKSETPIKVYGQEAAAITVTFDPVVRGKTLYAEVLVENQSPIDLDELSTDIGQVIAEQAGKDESGASRAAVYQTRFTDTDGILKIIDNSKKISVLHPGQKFSVVYAIRGILAEKLPGVYKKTNAAIQTHSTSSNVKVQVAPIKIASENDPLYGLHFDPEKDFLFMVNNKNGEELEGAEITLLHNGTEVESGVTDERSRLVVKRGDPDATYYVRIKKEGYKNYFERFEFPKRKSVYMETFVMSGDYDADDFGLTYASYHDDESGYVNLLTKTQKVDRYSDITFSIVATAATAGVTYELVQGRHVIRSQDAQGKTMAFMDLTPNLFYIDEPVFIRITTDKGDVFEIQLGLEFIKIPTSMSDSEDALAMLRDIKDAFGKDSVAVVEAPSEVKDKIGNSFDFTVNFPNLDKFDDDSGTGEIKNKSFNAKLDSNHVLTVTLGFSTEKRFKIAKDLVSMNFKITFTLVGKKDFENNTLSVSVGAKVSLGGTYTTPEIRYDVVFYFKVAFSLTGEASLSFKYTRDMKEHTNKIEPELGVSLTFSIAPRGGFGYEDLIALRIVGEASIKGELNILPKPVVIKATISGSLAGEAVTLSYVWKSYKIATFREHQFYPTEPASSRPPMYLPNGRPLADALEDPELYEAMTESQLPTAGAWNGQLGDGISEMQSGIATDSAPQIVTDGTNTIMVWTIQDASRGVPNASYLVFSVYDPESKTWSEPVELDEDINADTAPTLYAGADGIRIAYMESGKVFEEGEAPELTEYAKQLVFKTAKYDAESGTFTDFRTLDANADGAFASSPMITQAADGTTYLFWQANADGQIFGTDDTNMILCAKETEEGWDTPAVLAENLPRLSGFTCGLNAEGEPVYAYTTAIPNDDGTRTQTLYVADLSGNVTELASGSVSGAQFTSIPGKDASGLIWYQNGKYCATTDFVNVEDLCTEEYDVSDRFAVAGDRILFVANDASCAKAYSMRYDAEAGTFTKPVSIESGDNLYYESISVAKSGSDTLYAMRRTEASVSDDALSTSSALTGGILGETEDIRVDAPQFQYSDAKAGQALPLSMTVYNDGTTATDTCTLHILDASGNEIASDTQSAVIASGASDTVAFAPVLPAELTSSDYQVSVTAFESDKTPENNTAAIDLSRTDLSVETDITYRGNKTFLTIYARNNSSVPAPAIVHIQPASSEEETLTLFSEDIAPNTAAYWQLDSADILGDIYRDFVNITVSSDVIDADDSNNSACVILSKSGRDPYAAGDVNLDGVVELEDAMLTLKCYTSRIAHQKELGFSYTQQRCADIDGDGLVDLTDAMGILKYYVVTMSGSNDLSFTEYLAQKQNGGAEHESE